MNEIEKNSPCVLLNPHKESEIKREYIDFMRTRVVGQDRIIEKIAEALDGASAGFRNPKRPIASLLLLGPSQVGKTLIVEATAEFLFGDMEALTRLDGQDYSQRHQVADLRGSPLSYVGYDIDPVLTQFKIDRFAMNAPITHRMRGISEGEQENFFELYEKIRLLRRQEAAYGKDDEDDEGDKDDPEFKAKTKIKADALKRINTQFFEAVSEMGEIQTLLYHPRYGYLSVILLDEIERSCPEFRNLWLRILLSGSFDLSPAAGRRVGEKVRFVNSIIFATSNLGEVEVGKLLREQRGDYVGMGFVASRTPKERHDQDIYKISSLKAREFLGNPFINRFSSVLAARPLSRTEFEKILDLQIAQLQKCFAKEWDFPIILKIPPNVRRFIVDEATDNPEEQAALIGKKLNHYVTVNISRLKTTGQIQKADVIEVGLKDKEGGRKEPVFFKHTRYGKKSLVAI